MITTLQHMVLIQVLGCGRREMFSRSQSLSHAWSQKPHALPTCTQGQPHYAHSSQQGTTNWLLRCTTQTRSQIKVMLYPPNCKCKIPLECFKIIVVGFLVPLLNAVWTMLKVGVSCGMANRDHCPIVLQTSQQALCQPNCWQENFPCTNQLGIQMSVSRGSIKVPVWPYQK